MTTTPIASRRDLEARIVANAWRDPAYKKALLADPKAVVESELKKIDPTITLPEGLKVEVHEEDPNTFHLVLPRDPRDIKLGELVPDGQLEAVAPQTIAVVTSAVTTVTTANTTTAVTLTGPIAVMTGPLPGIANATYATVVVVAA